MRTILRILVWGVLLCPAGRASAQSLWPPATSGMSPVALLPAGTANSAPFGDTAGSADSVIRLPGATPAPGEGWLVALATPAAESVPAAPSYTFGQKWGNLWSPICDDCPLHSVQIFVGYDSFRGVSDDSWQNNGIHTGLNYGTKLGWLSDVTGIGLQAGGSAGSFNWSGNGYRPDSGAQTQGFVTYGLFRKPNATSHWSAALVQDWMLNNNFGEYSQNPTLSQLRGQVAYAISARNEFGLWGTQRVLDSTRNATWVGSTTWRPINQLNFFWHYKWAPGGADTWIWIGKPENDRLAGGGSLGDYVVGAFATVPLSDRVALYTQVQYMHPSARPGPAGGTENEWNFTTGLTFYPRRNARSTTVAGQCWTPAMPVANNGYFLVDTNKH